MSVSHAHVMKERDPKDVLVFLDQMEIAALYSLNALFGNSMIWCYPSLAILPCGFSHFMVTR